MQYNTQKLLQAVIMLVGCMNALYGCSACGCTTSPGWENQGFVSESGWIVDLREDYINQGTLRHGTNGAGDVSGLTEVEQFTTQYYTTLSVDYKSVTPFGVTLSLPYVDREHATIAVGETEATYSHTKSLGDARLVGRYQIKDFEGAWGIRLGIKLPTGSYTQTFDSGPSAGEALDRGLQPGSGMTDLIAGIYRYTSLNHAWDYFVQAGYKGALDEREGYKSGDLLTADVGLRWIGMKDFVPQLNLNTKYESKDSGKNADSDNSGGKSVYVSPGVTVSLGENLKGYVFVQIPVYLDVNGYQLVPSWTGSVGINYHF